MWVDSRLLDALGLFEPQMGRRQLQLERGGPHRQGGGARALLPLGGVGASQGDLCPLFEEYTLDPF